jgi:hypothetical protein
LAPSHGKGKGDKHVTTTGVGLFSGESLTLPPIKKVEHYNWHS